MSPRTRENDRSTGRIYSRRRTEASDVAGNPLRRVENLTLVTTDTEIPKYASARFWVIFVIAASG